MAKKGQKMAVFWPWRAEFCENQKKAWTFSYFYPREAVYQISENLAHQTWRKCVTRGRINAVRAKGVCKMAPSWLLYRKKSWGGGGLSKFGFKSSQISWGSQKNQIWSDRSGTRWRDNDRREKVPFQALIIKEIWKKCPKMRFLLFLTRFIKLYEKLTYPIL